MTARLWERRHPAGEFRHQWQNEVPAECRFSEDRFIGNCDESEIVHRAHEPKRGWFGATASWTAAVLCRFCDGAGPLESAPDESGAHSKTSRSFPRLRICHLAAWFVAMSASAATNELSDAEIEGRNIVQHLLAQRPAENFTNTGTLKIRDAKRQRTEVPVEFHTFVTETNWQALYFTTGTNKDHIASLTVIHTENQPNEYRLVAGRESRVDSRLMVLHGQQAMIPFAGSDFWLADLGLEFLHWPGQRLLKKELKRSQSCYVIESTNPSRESRVESRGPNAPSTTAYARVVSWMDIDSVRDSGQAAIVLAEAYDAKGKLVKEFEPKGIAKVRGQWQLAEMEIRNVKTGSRTRIEFNLESRSR